MKKLLMALFILCFSIISVRWFNTSPWILNLAAEHKLDAFWGSIYQFLGATAPETQDDIGLLIEILVSIVLGASCWFLGQTAWRAYARAR